MYQAWPHGVSPGSNAQLTSTRTVAAIPVLPLERKRGRGGTPRGRCRLPPLATYPPGVRGSQQRPANCPCLARMNKYTIKSIMIKSKISVIPGDRVEKAILLLRGHRVLLDSDLSTLYGVTTKRLNEQVRRNRDRFPEDFAFQLTRAEYAALRSHFATLKTGRGQHRKYFPRVFTEHGALMAATVLSSRIAVQASIQIVRTFVRLRQFMASHSDLARKLETIEKRYDAQFKVVFDAIRELMAPEVPSTKPRIGFRPGVD